MKLKIKQDLSSVRQRAILVELLSATIEGRGPTGAFSPYKPNEADDSYWTLDSGNNWKVKFIPGEFGVFEIIYRYQCAGNPFEQALAGWLKVRLDADPVAAPTGGGQDSDARISGG
jgi:hypothetical protein